MLSDSFLWEFLETRPTDAVEAMQFGQGSQVSEGQVKVGECEPHLSSDKLTKRA